MNFLRKLQGNFHSKQFTRTRFLHFSSDYVLGNSEATINIERTASRPGSTPILDTFHLSYAEAHEYLRLVLGIDSAHEKLRNDHVGLLREIVWKNHNVVPFQNVTNPKALPLEQCHLPCFDEIKSAMFSKQGGVCYQLNIFMNRLLTTLGYEISLVGGKFFGHDRYHVLNIVHDLEVKGQQHYVDVGASDPTFQPIPLDFATESAAYRESFWTYKLYRTPEGLIRRLNKPIEDSPDDDLYEDNSWQDGWRIICEIDPDTPRDVDYFRETMSYVFNALHPRPELKFFREGMLSMVYRNGAMVYFRDSDFYLEKGTTEAEHHVTSSQDELIDAYRKYMPTIPSDAVQAGIENTDMQFSQESKVTRINVKYSKSGNSRK